MTIAFFSDVHGNLPALHAVLADLDQRRPDFIFCLGDLVGYAPWPNEVVAEIRRRGIRQDRQFLRALMYLIDLAGPDTHDSSRLQPDLQHHGLRPGAFTSFR